ncbi:MAG: matrixin family metalloprotease [Rhodoferax sp.]
MRPLILTTLLLAGTAHAEDYIHAMLPDDRERPAYVLGTSHQYWPAGQINWSYNPSGQPFLLTTTAIVDVIKKAAARWSGMCNVTFNYLGTTTTAPNLNGAASTVDRTNVFGWDYLYNDQAGYSALTKSWWSGSALIDTDVVMNRSQSWTLSDVEGIMTHELGHVIGVGHSNVSASVMFANPYHDVGYMGTLRGDDANACAELYGAASTAESNRAMNWAESVYTRELNNGIVSSGTYDGYYYRYYLWTRNYVGTRNGNAYYMGSDGTIQDMGPLSGFMSQVRAAGY